MRTLNQSLHQTSHRSPLMRKAKQLGFMDVESLIYLAVKRGCHHFNHAVPFRAVSDPGDDQLSYNELIVLLLHGNNRDEPVAIRCAAQLLKSQYVSPHEVALLAIQERCETPLKYIATQGVKLDAGDKGGWQAILEDLADRGSCPVEGVLPHPSRFMINPGIQRGLTQKPFWLSPSEAINA